MKETEIFSKKLPTLSSLRRLCLTPQTVCPCLRHLSGVQLQLSTQLWLHQLHEENHLLLHATTEHSCRCHILVTIFRAFCMITLCFHPNYCTGKSSSQPWIVEKKSSNLHPIFFWGGGGGRAVEIWKDSLRNSSRSCFPLDLRATYRMVVCGETAGTVSRFRCIHLTVVRKHRQRLGQPAAGRGPLVSANKASGRSRHGEKSWPAPSAIAC